MVHKSFREDWIATFETKCICTNQVLHIFHEWLKICGSPFSAILINYKNQFYEEYTLFIQSDATNYCIWTSWTRRFVRIAKLLQRRWAHVENVGSRSQKDARQKSRWVTSDTPRSELGEIFFSIQTLKKLTTWFYTVYSYFSLCPKIFPYKLWGDHVHCSILNITSSV